MWDSTAPLQLKPESGESSSAAEDILLCPCIKKNLMHHAISEDRPLALTLNFMKALIIDLM